MDLLSLLQEQISFSPSNAQSFKLSLRVTLFNRDIADWAKLVRDKRLSPSLLFSPAVQANLLRARL